MDIRALEMSEAARAGCAERIGMAKLAKLAFDGGDLRPNWAELIDKLLNGTADAGEGIDLSLIAQLLGDKQSGLAIQHEVLRVAPAVPHRPAPASSRACACWRWRPRPTWAATRRSNSCSRSPASS